MRPDLATVNDHGNLWPMTLQQVVNCAPFRLAKPRYLTPYEWTVVESAIASGYESSGVFAMSAQSRAQIRALIGAISSQSSCPEWRTSAFGPAPAVAPYAYECLGAWFSRLDPASQARALYDIAYRGLLCGQGLAAGYVAYSCPGVSEQIGRGKRDMWEGAPQNGTIATGMAAEPCAYYRNRITYTPVKGKELLELFSTLGGQIPAEMAAAAQMASFINRTFLLGVQLREGVPAAQVANAADLLTVAKLAIEELALIWAPGKGASVLFLMDGADPAKMMQLLAAMAPDLLNEIVPGLQSILPGLIPAAGDPFWGAILNTATQIMPHQLAGFGAYGLGGDIPQPGTRSNTGVDVVDKPGSELPTNAPQILGMELMGQPLMTWLLVGTAAVLSTILLVRIVRP
jgi:hypothetical protein